MHSNHDNQLKLLKRKEPSFVSNREKDFISIEKHLKEALRSQKTPGRGEHILSISELKIPAWRMTSYGLRV